MFVAQKVAKGQGLLPDGFRLVHTYYACIHTYILIVYIQYIHTNIHTYDIHTYILLYVHIN